MKVKYSRQCSHRSCRSYSSEIGRMSNEETILRRSDSEIFDLQAMK